MSDGQKSQRGFTLIELLVVVAILGIISSIALIHLASALDKGKQKRTMADLHSIAEAVESYNIDHGFYPKGSSNWSALEAHVAPFFIKTPPPEDGWSHSWWVATESDGKSYSLVSLGKDRTLGTWGGGKTGSFDCDIVFSNGQFFQWPEGTQQ